MTRPSRTQAVALCSSIISLGRTNICMASEIEVTGSLVVDRHWESRHVRCGFLGCLAIHPVASIKMVALKVTNLFCASQGHCQTIELETTCAKNWKHLPLVCDTTRTCLAEPEETRFLSLRCFRFAHNLRDGVNQSCRIVFQ
jgi:hypothetical protein